MCAKKHSETPLMQQYYAIKAKHPGALLLFRVGDFYETFGEDAIKAAKILGIVQTSRKNGAASSVELAGFPHHSLDVYLPKLVRAGERVAICDQLEDPKLTKTIVKRGVTELVTPGISFNDQMLDRDKNNFLAAVHFGRTAIGVAFLDVSTGEFFAAQGNDAYIEKLIAGFAPSEIVYERTKKERFQTAITQRHHAFHLEDWVFQDAFAQELLTRHFHTHSLKGFGMDDMPEATIAAGAVLHYLSETQHDKLRHINGISRIDARDHMWLDRFTQRNLEIFHSSGEHGKSLLQVMDTTTTPMGSRMLRQWLAFPLVSREAIETRHADVTCFIDHPEGLHQLRQALRSVGDLERMTARLSVGKLGPKEARQLAQSLRDAAALAQSEIPGSKLRLLQPALAKCDDAVARIEEVLAPEPPALVQKGGVVADGYNAELDELRKIAFSGKDYLLALQDRECKATGITSLKVGFNNVFGYYLEVTNVHKSKVPEGWIRKQTLVNAERYITEELKEYEQKILGAEDKILALEQRLYQELLDYLMGAIPAVQHCARLLAELDCLMAFAHNAIEQHYCKPSMNDGRTLRIEEGRHPVIEQSLPLGEQYIPNDIRLDREVQQIIMLTGPNMAGKSALLRQCALISLMAQVGSYIPARAAELCIIDKLFTRVGASDNISQGESTFMVEMNETASILNNLSSRSLILLDEIGRGTSTYDGISIAWSIAEYLCQHPHRPLTLFATHYHELNEMASRFDRIKNYTIAIKETKDRIIFLRKLIEGGSEHSFGIHVAKMAGMPDQLIDRAQRILAELEASDRSDLARQGLAQLPQDVQLSFFQLDDPVLSQIKDELIHIDINSLTPVEALFKLNEIKKLLGKR